jgi:hypothetical protein
MSSKDQKTKAIVAFITACVNTSLAVSDGPAFANFFAIFKNQIFEVAAAEPSDYSAAVVVSIHFWLIRIIHQLLYIISFRTFRNAIIQTLEVHVIIVNGWLVFAP